MGASNIIYALVKYQRKNAYKLLIPGKAKSPSMKFSPCPRINIYFYLFLAIALLISNKINK